MIDILQKKADNSKPKRTYTKLNSGKTPARPKTHRILLGLMTYDMKKKKYTRVSLVKGGGTRKVDLPVDFNREDVIQYAVKPFYPEVEYPGSTSGVSYEIANFKQEPVSSLVDSDGTVHEFTIKKYCELCKTHQFNLYLLVKENPEVEDEQVKEDDSDLLIPVFGSPVEEKIPNLSLEAGQTECQPVVSSQFYHASSMSSVDDRSRRNRRSTPSSTSTSTGGTSGEETSFNWTLIGSSSDRRQLREEQQNALEKSLKADQEKEASKRDAAQRLESLESLRSARLAHVPPEPDEMSNGEKVKISIRHPSLGAVSRYFAKRETMLAVYDWCGSLSLEPEFFGLYTTLPKTCVSPCLPVDSVAGAMLYVEEQSVPTSLSNDELEVSIRGFGLPHLDPIFEGDNDSDLPSSWHGLSVTPIPSPVEPESTFSEHSRLVY